MKGQALNMSPENTTLSYVHTSILNPYIGQENHTLSMFCPDATYCMCCFECIFMTLYFQFQKTKRLFHSVGDIVMDPHLQGQAVVSGSLVFAAVVLTIIHVNMIQLQEAYKISGRLQRGRHWS